MDPREELFGFVWGQYLPILFYPIDRQFIVLAYQAWSYWVFRKRISRESLTAGAA